MSIAYWCILIAAALPYLWVSIAKGGAADYNNKDPRGWVAKQDSYRVRNANGAHPNAFEAFAPFAAAVVLAQLAGVPSERIAAWSLAFIVLRVLHGLLYIGNRPSLRSLAWVAGFSCVLVLLVQAALRVAAAA